MKRWMTAAVCGLLLLACSGDDQNDAAADETPTETTTPPTTAAPEAPPQYPPFDEIDPHTSLFFVTLEGTGLVESQGEQRLYGLGVNVCQRLDAGQSIEEQLADDAGLGDDMGSIVGAAVTDMCPQHGQLVEDYLAAN